jgi:hypothetical protein
MCECCNKKGKEKWTWETYEECIKKELKKRGVKWG